MHHNCDASFSMSVPHLCQVLYVVTDRSQSCASTLGRLVSRAVAAAVPASLSSTSLRRRSNIGSSVCFDFIVSVHRVSDITGLLRGQYPSLRCAYDVCDHGRMSFIVLASRSSFCPLLGTDGNTRLFPAGQDHCCYRSIDWQKGFLFL